MFYFAFFISLSFSPPFDSLPPSSAAFVGIGGLAASACVGKRLKSASCPLRCAGRKHCEFMLMKLICSVSSNQSHGEYPDCRSERESGGEASLLVSPLVVAGIVIGLVLFLSCVTIIVGSLRKDSRLRNPHLRASYGPDGYSFGGSVGELRSTCLEDFPPGLDFDSYSLSQVNHLYPDSPPRYDECVGPGCTHLYIPTDDPPPYSLCDPRQNESEGAEEGPSTAGTASPPSAYPRIASISFPSEAAPPYEVVPPYEAVVAEHGQPLPLVPCDLSKYQTERHTDANRRQSGISQIS
ncbi:protein BEAN1-like isoform X2 [Syngnathus typhle]|uniref:protein BEAN1-like isoform X2 n=1 Tax=Syngnathus typhle TaxID=161592 RepID=UPI002A6A3609|nr:protein BEAN1-like isoform X2 [Syngnathus typhle]